jgi:hypothetical protein
MNASKAHFLSAASFLGLVLAVCLTHCPSASAITDETFAVLQIGTRAYTNVTVTTKAKNYIFIIHSSGMNNIRIADLPEDIREQLGYGASEKTKAATNSAAAWAKAGIAKLDMPGLQAVRKQFTQGWSAHNTSIPPLRAMFGSELVLTVLGILLLVYLFHCYCCLLICQKTGQDPGVLIWVPILQLLPVVRAAGLSAWWAVAWLVPVLNLVVQVLWSLEIAKARGKSVWVGVFLLVPFTSLFAFLYLAFSNGAQPEEDDREPEVMSLQTA